VGPRADIGSVARITVRTLGGGGYGNPWQRDPTLATRDVARG